MSPFYTNKIASNQFGQFGFDIKPIKISEKGTKHNNVENKIIAFEMVSSDKKLPRLFSIICAFIIGTLISCQ